MDRPVWLGHASDQVTVMNLWKEFCLGVEQYIYVSEMYVICIFSTFGNVPFRVIHVQLDRENMSSCIELNYSKYFLTCNMFPICIAFER